MKALEILDKELETKLRCVYFTVKERRVRLIHSVCKKYSIKSLERDNKHYYFIIRGGF